MSCKFHDDKYLVSTGDSLICQTFENLKNLVLSVSFQRHVEEISSSKIQLMEVLYIAQI